MKHYITLGIILVLTWLAFFFDRKSRIIEEKRYFDSIYHILHRAQALDSVRSIQDRRYVDSINVRLNLIESGIRKTRVELVRIRTRNEHALRKLDSLMPTNRPDF